MTEEDRLAKMRETAEELDERFHGYGYALVVFDEVKTSIISNVTADDVVTELGELIDNMKEAGHGRKH